MSLHKIFSLLFLFTFIHSGSASVSKDLIKKILAAASAFEQYEIVFEKHFKYPKEKDTLSERFESAVYKTGEDFYIGWHRISYIRSGAKRSLIAANNEGLHRVNYKENLYYSTMRSDNQKLLMLNLSSNLYKPLYYTREELERFNEGTKTDQYIYLEKTDTGKDNKNLIRYISKTRICIDRKSYLPVSEEISSVSNGNEQYSLYKLNSYKLLSKNEYKPLLKYSDSLINVIHTYTNGDSLKKSRKDLYRKLKPGDSVVLFKASLSNGSVFDMKTLKDSIVIFDFFYTTCVPCIAAVPELNNIYSLYSARGVQLFGVNAFDTDWDNIPAYIKERGVLYPIIKTGKQTVYDYGVTGFPRMIIIKNGVVVKIYYGFAKGMEKELGVLLEKLLLNP